MIQIRSLVANNLLKNIRVVTVRSVQTSAAQNAEAVVKKVQENDQPEKKLDEVSQKLMSFFDPSEDWGKETVTTGRSWRIDELRIKSNEDLHTLWFVLYKERNMLMTMEQAAKDETQNMASPERLDKVEESMKNIEEVVKERNKAYWQLEVGDDKFVERRREFRRDIFGRWRTIASSEHLIPYWMNTEWRKTHAPGFGDEVTKFNRKLREKKLNSRVSQILRQGHHCRQLLKRFPDIDIEYLQELYPDVDVQVMKKNLNEYTLQDRTKRFNSIFYSKQKNL